MPVRKRCEEAGVAVVMRSVKKKTDEGIMQVFGSACRRQPSREVSGDNKSWMKP
jgi:hypothetical protein